MKGRLPSKPPPTSVVANSSWPTFSAISASLGHSPGPCARTQLASPHLGGEGLVPPACHMPPSPSGGLLLNTKGAPWAPERGGGKRGFADGRQGAVGARRWLGVLGC